MRERFCQIKSKNIDVLPIEGLVHAAYGAELSAHGAGVIVLRGAVGPYGLGGLRVQGAGPLSLPVQGPAGVSHFVIDLPGAPDALAMSAAWAAILLAMMPCFTSSRLGRARCSAGVT